MIRELLPCQTHDPAKGSFMVTPMATGKHHRGSDGRVHPVFKAPAKREDGIEFIVVGPYSYMYGSRGLLPQYQGR